MSTRTIVVPEPIRLKNPVDGQPIKRVEVDRSEPRCSRCQAQIANAVIETEEPPYTIFRLLVERVFTRKEWLKPLTASRMAMKILDRFENAEAGTSVELPDEWWRKLRTSLESADFELPALWGNQLVPLCDAILDARDDSTA